jgi:hypothetical protein
VVYGTRLESAQGVKALRGSNPLLSAMNQSLTSFAPVHGTALPKVNDVG